MTPVFTAIRSQSTGTTLVIRKLVSGDYSFKHTKKIGYGTDESDIFKVAKNNVRQLLDLLKYVQQVPENKLLDPVNWNVVVEPHLQGTPYQDMIVITYDEGTFDNKETIVFTGDMFDQPFTLDVEHDDFTHLLRFFEQTLF